MKHLLNTTLVCTVAIGISLLSACSMTPPLPQHPDSHFDRPEQQHKKRPHAQDPAVMNAFNHACDGQSIGATVQVKVNDHVLDGQCQLNFQPTPPQR